jgi:hypothetical protein
VTLGGSSFALEANELRTLVRPSTTLLNLWFRSFRDKLSRVEIILENHKEVSLSYAVFSAELKQRGCKRYDLMQRDGRCT